MCMELDELAQRMFDSREVVFVREHVVALRIDEGERIGAFQQLEGFHHVGEGDGLVLHSCQHARGRGTGESFFGVIEQVVLSGFFEEGLREGVSLFGRSFGIDPSSDVSLLYFLSFFGWKFGQQEFFWKIGCRSDQQQPCDILGVSFEDVESHPSSHRGACDDPGFLLCDVFLCVFEDGDRVGDPVSDGCCFHGALRLSVRSVVEEDRRRVVFLCKVEDSGCFCSCGIGGIS